MNPLGPCYEFFLSFVSYLPLPVVAFFYLIITFFVISTIIGWFQ